MEYYDSKIECVAFNCVRTIPGLPYQIEVEMEAFAYVVGFRKCETSIKRHINWLAALHQKVIMGYVKPNVKLRTHTQSERKSS